MKSEDWFGLGVRLLGVWQLMKAAQYLVTAMDVRLNLFQEHVNPLADDDTGAAYLFYCLAYGAIGMGLIFGAKLLTQFAYPADNEPDTLANDDSSRTESPSE